MKTNIQDLIPLHARQLSSEIESATGRWMFAPGGIQHITPGCGNGGSAAVTLRIDESTVAALNASLTEWNAENPAARAYFDKEHDKHAGATGWPIKFVWSNTPQPGVYVEHEPTAFGKELIEGKVMRAFSPSFYSDAELPKQTPLRGQRIAPPSGKSGSPQKPARMIGLVFPACGTLTNNPAFTKILPLWAKNAGAPSGTVNNQKNKHMKLKNEEKAALQARKNELEPHLVALRASVAADPNDAASAEQLRNEESELEIVSLKLTASAAVEEKELLAQELLANRTSAFETEWQLLCRRGAAVISNAELKAQLQGDYIADPTKTMVMLKAMKGSPALQPERRITLSPLQVTKEDTNDVLKAYNAEKNPLKRGNIYRKELSPILAKGESIAFGRSQGLFAANVLGALVGDIISQRTLELVVTLRPMLQGIVTDFTSDQAHLDQEIQSRAIGLPTVQNFGSAASDTADVDYPVTLDKHKQVLFSYTAAEYNATGRNLVQEHSEALAVALGNYYVDTVAALITDAFTDEIVAAASTKSFDSVVDATSALNLLGAPDMNRFGWVNGPVAAALRKDELMIANFDKNNESGYAHWTGVQGFKNIWEYPGLPANAVNLIAFFAHRAALILATRLSIDPAALIGAGYAGTIKTVTDPVSGLSVISNQWITQDTLKINDRLISLFGCARGLITSGHKWVSA